MTFSLISVSLQCGDSRLTSSSAVHGFPIMFQTDLAVLFQKMNKNRMKIASKLKEYGFDYVTLDLLGYRTGSMNETLEDKEIKK